MEWLFILSIGLLPIIMAAFLFYLHRSDVKMVYDEVYNFGKEVASNIHNLIHYIINDGKYWEKVTLWVYVSILGLTILWFIVTPLIFPGYMAFLMWVGWLASASISLIFFTGNYTKPNYIESYPKKIPSVENPWEIIPEFDKDSDPWKGKY